MADHTTPSKETRDAEAAQARQSHEADRMPTDEESERVEGRRPAAGVVESEQEMQQRGANQKGEGRI